MDTIKKDITAHSGDEEKEVTHLDRKDMHSLKMSRYKDLSGRFTKSYVLQHKSGKIVELKAASALHACKFIGWRHRHVKVLSETDIGDQNGK